MIVQTFHYQSRDGRKINCIPIDVLRAVMTDRFFRVQNIVPSVFLHKTANACVFFFFYVFFNVVLHFPGHPILHTLEARHEDKAAQEFVKKQRVRTTSSWSPQCRTMTTLAGCCVTVLGEPFEPWSSRSAPTRTARSAFRGNFVLWRRFPSCYKIHSTRIYPHPIHSHDNKYQRNRRNSPTDGHTFHQDDDQHIVTVFILLYIFNFELYKEITKKKNNRRRNSYTAALVYLWLL